MQRKAAGQKVLILGVDGMDPSLTSKFVNEGKMPNTKKIIEMGAQRKDLVLLGGVPTITPPLWTTLSTGAYPNTHGITCFWLNNNDVPSKLIYALNSTLCKAEPLWNVTAESGKKTLVWHWPGSSWPPTSDSPNLHVVDGASPAQINQAGLQCDSEKVAVAATSMEKVIYQPRPKIESGAGCILTDVNDHVGEVWSDQMMGGAQYMENLILDFHDGEEANDYYHPDLINSPLKEAAGWAAAPEGAKEFTIITSTGLVRRPALLLKNSQGIYDKVAIYKSKKESEPLVTLKEGESPMVIDDVKVGEETFQASRYYKVFEIAPDGSSVRVYMSNALKINIPAFFHPQSLYQDVIDHVGHVPSITSSGYTSELIEKGILPSWTNYIQWQTDAMNHVIEKHDYDVVFSHLHNIDLCGHQFWHWLIDRKKWLDVENWTKGDQYFGYVERVYEDTDKYFGGFMHLLDEGWTIIITSDHGLLCSEEHSPLLGDAFGCNIRVMEELGYTVLKKDADGKDLKKIDWEKTKAVAPRGSHIYINLKGRYPNGSVDPKDKEALETEIISALYNYRDPETGRRVVSHALRNRDAALIGMSGPECGDIIYFIEQGFNRLHGDATSTMTGTRGTSVSPIFIAAGKGIKKGFTTDRVIRQVDVAPTIAVLAGVRMPAQCEGAPIYQILEEEY